MKEHPDYKYRPRRKPKTLVKSPNSSSQSNSNNSQQHHNNHHSNSTHHHSMKSSSSNSPVLNNHHHSSNGKYPFVPSLDLPINFPPSQHQQQNTISQSGFPGIHYPLVDPTLALDLQARLQAMYAGVYHPWRYFPLVSNPEQSPPSPPPSSIYVSMKNSSSPSSSKISPTTTTASPPLIDHCEQNSVPTAGQLKASII